MNAEPSTVEQRLEEVGQLLAEATAPKRDFWIGRTSITDEELDPAPYKSRYNLAMLYLERASELATRCQKAAETGERAPAQEKQAALEAGIEELEKLARRLASVRDKLEIRLRRWLSRTRERDAVLLHFIEQQADAAAALELGAWVLVGKQDHGRFEEVGERARLSTDSTFLYDMACSYSVRAEHRRDPDARQQDLEHSLDFLARAVQIDPTVAADAREDDTLRAVRKDPATSDKYQGLLGASESQPAKTPELPLSELRILGEHAAALAEKESIRTPDDLLAHAKLPAERLALATRLGVGKELVLEWAQLAELARRIAHLDLRDASLLRDCHIATLAELAAVSDPSRLAVALDGLARAAGEKAGPDAERIALWMEQAAAARTLIQT